MHTLWVIAGGLLLLGLFVLLGRRRGARAFAPVWLLLALVNMGMGVSRAGYGVREELPILLVVFAIPALVSAVLLRCLRRD